MSEEFPTHLAPLPSGTEAGHSTAVRFAGSPVTHCQNAPTGIIERGFSVPQSICVSTKFLSCPGPWSGHVYIVSA